MQILLVVCKLEKGLEDEKEPKKMDKIDGNSNPCIFTFIKRMFTNKKTKSRKTRYILFHYFSIYKNERGILSGVLPYKRSLINGRLNSLPTRLDTNRFELGLIELAKAEFDPADYVFQEGQVLKDIEWLSQEDSLYSVAEHDYLKEDGSYGGIVIGLSLSPKYYLRDDKGKILRDPKTNMAMFKVYTDDQLKDKAKKISNDIISRIRKTLPNPPIIVGVMKLQQNNGNLPGNFILKGKISAGQSSADWKDMNESYLFLPANTTGIKDQYGDFILGFNRFKDEMDRFLPGFAGVTGLARIVDGNLVELTVHVNAEFDSTVEVIQFTQFAISMSNESFPKEAQLNLYINTIDEPKAIYVRQANGDDFMHIYRE
ncbi:CamS family sex pheromone protein [Tepidibacillus marianensis]|uniref:CamS family sex pheromone protein n=1 Tax=Tepidibacillus marianensis TaxID=3131995 RepID=UPI0030D14D8A